MAAGARVCESNDRERVLTRTGQAVFSPVGIVLPVRVPSDALQFAKLIRGVAEGALARWPAARDHKGAVVEELELDRRRVRNLPDLRVDPRVVFADAPDAFRTFADQRSTLNAQLSTLTLNSQRSTLNCQVSRERRRDLADA